jgi:glycosyltransferase involved in cell wall biosynthesis
MRVLITHELFPPEVWRMGEKINYDIAKRLMENGIEVKVLTTGDPKIKQIDGIPTVRLPVQRYLMNLSALWICKHARGFDLIQTNNYNACLPSYVAAKLMSKPIVCLIHGMYGRRWLKMRGHVLGSLSMLVEKFQVTHDYDKMIFFSKFGRDAALEAGVKKRITEVIKPGFDFEKYKVGKKEPFVLFVGRLAKQKGLEYLMEAARGLPEIKFLIVGSGEEEKNLKSIAPNNVKFLGFLLEKKLIELYSRALIFCLPSVGETFGFVQLEAMASGCAVVSTLPLDYEGIKINWGNVGELKKALRYLIENPNAAAKMGKINRRKASEYSWNKFMKRLIEIYEELL